MTDETTKRLQRAIDEVIQNQIQNNNPPETEQTLARLKLEGYTEQQALQLIGHVVTREIVEVIQHGRLYNEQEYINRLKELPKLPVKGE